MIKVIVAIIRGKEIYKLGLKKFTGKSTFTLIFDYLNKIISPSNIRAKNGLPILRI